MSISPDELRGRPFGRPKLPFITPVKNAKLLIDIEINRVMMRVVRVKLLFTAPLKAFRNSP